MNFVNFTSFKFKAKMWVHTRIWETFTLLLNFLPHHRIESTLTDFPVESAGSFPLFPRPPLFPLVLLCRLNVSNGTKSKLGNFGGGVKASQSFSATGCRPPTPPTDSWLSSVKLVQPISVVIAPCHAHYCQATAHQNWGSVSAEKLENCVILGGEKYWKRM